MSATAARRRRWTRAGSRTGRGPRTTPRTARGVPVDASPSGRSTTLDACRISNGPVTANHTTARAVFHHARGKTDEALKAIAETGGVIGVLCVPACVTDAATPTIEHMLDHVDYIANLVGWQ